MQSISQAKESHPTGVDSSDLRYTVSDLFMRRIFTIAFAVLVAAPLAFPQQALACSCMYYEDESERFNAYYEHADLIFQGIPIEKEEGNQHTYNIAVEKVWKGQADAYINIVTGENSAICGVNMVLDERVIIFASKVDGKYHTGLCSGTTFAKDAKPIIAWLNEDNIESSSSSSLSSSSSIAVDCSPYICVNGDTFDACSEDGHQINYLVAPCQFSGGNASESSASSVSFDGFTDVEEGHQNFKAISFVKDEGIVEGYADGTYGPTLFINRAEFTKIIIEATFPKEVIDECESEDLFSDVSQSDWFADYVCVAKEQDVIGGYPDGSFKPAGNVNFAEAAKIIVRSFAIDTNPEDHFGVWWKPYVFALARIGGLPTSFSDPNQELTRGDMAEMVYRVIKGMNN